MWVLLIPLAFSWKIVSNLSSVLYLLNSLKLSKYLSICFLFKDEVSVDIGQMLLFTNDTEDAEDIDCYKLLVDADVDDNVLVDLDLYVPLFGGHDSMMFKSDSISTVWIWLSDFLT